MCFFLYLHNKSDLVVCKDRGDSVDFLTSERNKTSFDPLCEGRTEGDKIEG